MAKPHVKTISTHAPRAGSDPTAVIITETDDKFQPTLPVRGATERDFIIRQGEKISTHAPRAGSDWASRVIFASPSYFNPRSPCGERLQTSCLRFQCFSFQPTLPVRGATGTGGVTYYLCNISTHAPRAGSDSNGYTFDYNTGDFNPRSPCGERPSPESCAETFY